MEIAQRSVEEVCGGLRSPLEGLDFWRGARRLFPHTLHVWHIVCAATDAVPSGVNFPLAIRFLFA